MNSLAPSKSMDDASSFHVVNPDYFIFPSFAAANCAWWNNLAKSYLSFLTLMVRSAPSICSNSSISLAWFFLADFLLQRPPGLWAMVGISCLRTCQITSSQFKRCKHNHRNCIYFSLDSWNKYFISNYSGNSVTLKYLQLDQHFYKS